MARTLSSRQSLAGNLARVTFAAIALAAFVVAVFALVGVYGFAREQVRAGHLAYRQIIVQQINGRLRNAAAILNNVAVESIGDDGAVDRKAVARLFGSSTEYFEHLVLADTNGRVVSSYPLFQSPPSVAGQRFFRPAEATSTPKFMWIPPEEEARRGDLWVMRLVDGGKSGRYVLLGRVRTDFAQVACDEVSSQRAERSALVVDGQDRIAFLGAHGPAPVMGETRYEPDATGAGATGQVRTLGPGGRSMTGFYGSTSGSPGLEWRVLVLEPTVRVLGETWRALMPAGIATLLFGTIAVGFAWVGARRIITPIREIGHRAEKAASGAYVRPIVVRRNDEVGSLSEAFNALALRLNALHDVAQLLASASQPEQVQDYVVSSLSHLVRSDGVAVYVLDAASERLVLSRFEGSAGLVLPSAVRLDATSWLVEVLHSSGPSCVPRPQSHDGGGQSVAAPLAVGEEAVGLVVLTRDRKGFSDPELEMLRTFSAQAAVALRTARLFEVETRSRREAEVLRQVAERLANPSDLASALHDVGAMSVELLEASAGGVALRESDSFDLAQEVLSPDAEDWLELWMAEGGETPRSDPLLVELSAAASAPAAALAAHGARRALLAPLVYGSAVRGVLSFEYDGAGASPGGHHVDLAGAIAKQMSLALQNAHLYRQVRERAGNLETIFRITQAVSSSLQITVVLNRVLDVVQKIFSADAVSLMTYDPKRRTIGTAMARGAVNSEMLHLERAPGQDVPGQVFEGRQPILVSELSSSDWPLARLASTQGLHSLVAVPLLARGRSIGVLTVFALAPNAFSDEDVELLRTFGSQAALAIDTADLYGKEHVVASVLQSSIMPDKLPDLDGIDSSSVYIAAGTEGDIGGDYFDLFKAPDGRIVLAMGDVCGKGVLAATKTSMIRYMVRGLVAAGVGPARALREINRTVTENGDPGDIVTLWLGVLDLERRELTYANGGHPPALLLSSESDELARLDPTGPLLGAVATAPYEERVVSAEVGDYVLLYTDGVSEARKGNRFFGEGRVRRALEAGGSASAVAQRLLTAVTKFAPGGLRDDVAILAVKILPDDKEAAAQAS